MLCAEPISNASYSWFDSMGIDIHTAQFLASVRRKGIPLGRTITLGRQAVYMPKEVYKSRLTPLGLGPAKWPYADDLFAGLGATTLDIMDASNYEGANVIWNMNQPIEAALKESYDCVFDGGTLEHIFNFPIALKNCMQMVKVGGHLIIATMMNNWAGHGFYQFSPELFYNAVSSENGFAPLKAFLVHQGRWYSIANPKVVHKRVELLSKDRVTLFFLAKRQECKQVFASWPQQTDYSALWSQVGGQKECESPGTKWKDRLTERFWLLKSLQSVWRKHKERKMFSLSNQEFFTPVEIESD